ncbi:hypothetical protein HYZ97_04750 [Candidatus Pacearchaeota archaeon]|nr:hypothetical protein [Candidatus Pacearchaeota archaeon]
MKRVIIPILLSIMLFTQLVSAQYLPPVRQGVESVIRALIDIFEPILQVLLGGQVGWTGLYLFEKLLLLVILVCVVYLVLGRVPLFDDPTRKGIRWIIAILMPLMGIRFVDEAWLNAVFVQYQALAVVLGVVLPMILFFFFLYSMGADYPIIRKVGWIMFIGIYTGLWSTVGTQGTSNVFFWAVIAALIFLIFDTKIYMYYQYQTLIRHDKQAKHREIGRINMEIQEIERMIAAGAMDATAGRKQIYELTKLKKWLFKQF